MFKRLQQNARVTAGAARRLPAIEAEPGWLSGEQAIMGTSIRVELWTDDRTRGQSAIAAVMDLMHGVDRLMSPFKPESELSQINREAAHHPVRVSKALYDIIARSIRFSELSEGAFDITFAGAGHLYDYRLGTVPSDSELETARAGIGYRNLILDPIERSVRFGRPGMRIDLGGFAKGLAVDQGAELLRQRGIRHGIVTAGGDSRIVGDRRGRPWCIGVRDPRRPDSLAAVLPLADVAVSTSGDYERYFEKDGVRHHHVIDPATGRSAQGIHSVTVVAPDGLTSEAMSKSVFVLGVERGLRLIESMPAVDAVVVDAQARLHYSSGLLDERRMRAQ